MTNLAVLGLALLMVTVIHLPARAADPIPGFTVVRCLTDAKYGQLVATDACKSKKVCTYPNLTCLFMETSHFKEKFGGKADSVPSDKSLKELKSIIGTTSAICTPDNCDDLTACIGQAEEEHGCRPENLQAATPQSDPKSPSEKGAQ
jgi:hypothetical protein